MELCSMNDGESGTVPSTRNVASPPVFSFIIEEEEEEEETFREETWDSDRSGSDSNLTGFPILSTNICQKRQSEASLMDYHDKEEPECTSSPSPGHEVISFTIKEEDDDYPLDHQEFEREEGIVNPTAGFGTMERKLTGGNPIKCTEEHTKSNTSSGKSNDKEEHQSCKKGSYARSRVWFGNNLKYKSKMTTLYERGSRDPIHLEGSGKYNDYESNLKKAEFLTFSSNREQIPLPHTCVICEKSFSLKRNLIAHVRTHTLEKAYQCTECEKSFSLKSYLRRHQIIHKDQTARPFPCTECEKSFNQKCTLIKHLRTHTGERPYTCNDCGKRFSEKSNLVGHQRIHSVKRPYQCSECDKSFSQKTHLMGHKTKHTGIRPYQCTKCKKQFTVKCSLVRHQRRNCCDILTKK